MHIRAVKGRILNLSRETGHTLKDKGFTNKEIEEIREFAKKNECNIVEILGFIG